MGFPKRSFSLVAVLILGLGLAAAGIGLTVKHRYDNSKHENHITNRTPYTMTRTKTLYPNGGTPFLKAVFTRFQKSDGSFKEIIQTYKPDGTPGETGTLIGVASRGVFSVNEATKTLVFQSQKDHVFHLLNEKAMKENTATYLGEKTILGFRCLGQRDPEDTETYISPELGFPLLETITGSTDRVVTEAIRVDLGEPADFQLPDYRVDYTRYENRIANMEKEGRPDLAKQMKGIEERSKGQLSKVGTPAK